ncbi:hypothetical protein VW35_17115 [Devosia soli]|uniref:Calcineurin-like phosphoesterase domain-containing protein n=1 Tax=Devosia soli TaxID=361041 RepID=A0A0F5L4H2_9HYPH|nr:metallophosphoesterase [Devosia soli]KKB76512.1 hypothetical protein VW35_17115 [Devosia soli]
MTLKFIVLSDLHVMPEGQLSLTLDTGARLERAVETIAARYDDVDFCVLAGDLTDLGQPAAYQRFNSLVEKINIPVHLTLGNHDDRESFLSVFGQAHVAETGKIDKAFDAKGYRIILLDSSEPGRVDGLLTDAQMSWLKARLAEAMDRPVIVILHHNANALHIESDDIRILDAEPFLAALKAHPDIRQVIAGHVHLTSTALWRGIPFTTLAGGHYYCTVDQPHVPMRRLRGPAQMAFVIGTADQTTVHFDNYIDDHAEIMGVE